MSRARSEGEPAEAELRARLDAACVEREHWRRLAEQRSNALSELSHRPLVRVLLAAEGRAEPVRRELRASWARLRLGAARLGLAVPAVAHRGGPLVADLTRSLSQLPQPRREGRSITLVILANAGTESSFGQDLARVTKVAVCADASTTEVARVSEAIEAAASDLIGLVRTTSEPLDDTWLTRLALSIKDGVVAATPTLVHPTRSIAHATRYDGLVRSAGLSIDVDADGAPVVSNVEAGRRAAPAGALSLVSSGSSACILLDRAAYLEAGGLPPGEDLETAVVELCIEMRARGGEVAAVPSAVLLDHRPVLSRADLRSPIPSRGRAWKQAVDRSGPRLVRSAGTLRGETLRIAISVAAPSRKVAARWGDWHLGVGLGDALRRLGHDSLLQTARESDDAAGRACDVHVVLRGLHPVRRTRGQRHVLWIISHPESIDDEELDAADLVLVASSRFANHVRTRTSTPVETFLQATDHRRFRPRPLDPVHEHPITVVAKSRDIMRPVVADAIAAGLRPSIYGSGWHGFVDDRLIAGGYVENAQLPTIYSSAGVVLNDHWETMRTWGFVSNRIFDVLACEAPIISDRVDGIAELFGGAALEYDDASDLGRLVHEVLTDRGTARQRGQRGRERVLAAHTFDHRARTLLDLLRGV